MLTFPKKIEAFLLPYIKSLAAKKKVVFAKSPHQMTDKDLRYFAKGVVELSDLFTKERCDLPAGYLNHLPWHIAYLLYFFPINFAKACFVFEKFPKEFWQKKHFAVLDLGCGPASASLAFLHVLEKKNPSATVEIQLIDQNKKILASAKHLLDSWKVSSRSLETFSFRAEAKNLLKVRLNKKFDLVVFHHVLNEMTSLGAIKRAEYLAPFLLQHLSPKALVAVIEPALKRPSREMMALRNHLLEKDFALLSPCLHQETCPMLATTRSDWCHFYADWEEPDYLKKMDRLISKNNRYLKLAYLILSWQEAYACERPKDYFRVVSNRMATRGKTELALCGPAGGLRMMRLDRDRSQKNVDIDQSRRGDIVEWKSRRLATDFPMRLQVKVGPQDGVKKMCSIMEEKLPS